MSFPDGFYTKLYSVEEVAHGLGIDLGSQRYKIVMDNPKLAEEAYNMYFIVFHSNIHQDQHTAVLVIPADEEVAQRYMPTLIESARYRIKNKKKTHWIWEPLLSHLAPTSAFGKYIREFPTESKALFVELMGWIVLIGTDPASWTNLYLEDHQTSRSMDDVITILLHLAKHFFLIEAAATPSPALPPSATPVTTLASPSLTSKFTETVYNIYTGGYARTGETQEQANQRLKGTRVGDLLVQSNSLVLLFTGQLRNEAFVRYRDQGYVPWWTCEARKDVECLVRVGGDVHRPERGENVEMKACGKCLSLRYCSPEHQRAHWKIHKKSCYAPTW